MLSGTGTLTTNLVSNTPGFVNRAGYNYHLAASSPAVNAGTDPGVVNGVSLVPVFEYASLAGNPRPRRGVLDLGASSIDRRGRPEDLEPFGS